MNYLAHLHIADHCSSHLLGNLLGDFVKGDPEKLYSQKISDGIRLHRFVDSYIDSHDLIKQAKSYFPMAQRRFAGIALDMFWDHCLSSGWNQHSTVSLDDFIQTSKREVIYQQRQLSKELLPTNYLTVTTRMWEMNWLSSYQYMHTMKKALRNISKRRARFEILAECYDTLDESYQPLTAIFNQLYPQILKASKEYNA